MQRHHISFLGIFERNLVIPNDSYIYAAYWQPSAEHTDIWELLRVTKRN